MLATRAPLGALLGALALSLTNCSVSIVHYADPGDFARNLFHIAREDSWREWGTQLTQARREMGDEYVRNHFNSWRRILVELQQAAFGGDLRIAHFRVEEGSLDFEANNEWHHLFHVAMEEGGWKIDQD